VQPDLEVTNDLDKEQSLSIKRNKINYVRRH